MHGRGKLSEAAVRNAERRKREDESPRLLERVPKLESLKLEIEERRPESTSADVQHTKRVPVDFAPALFELSCCDRSCKDGGHDITRPLLMDLERGETSFEGEDTCHGTIGTANCGRILRWIGTATYKP